jgi:hypothetical protein
VAPANPVLRLRADAIIKLPMIIRPTGAPAYQGIRKLMRVKSQRNPPAARSTPIVAIDHRNALAGDARPQRGNLDLMLWGEKVGRSHIWSLRRWMPLSYSLHCRSSRDHDSVMLGRKEVFVIKITIITICIIVVFECFL